MRLGANGKRTVHLSQVELYGTHAGKEKPRKHFLPPSLRERLFGQLWTRLTGPEPSRHWPLEAAAAAALLSGATQHQTILQAHLCCSDALAGQLIKPH